MHSNPALNMLLKDYTNYHLVLAVTGSVMVLVLVALSLFFLARFQNTSRLAQSATPKELHRWTFEKKIYFSFWVVCALVSLIMAVIVAANVSSVLNPRQGFSLLIESLEIPPVGSHREALLQSFNSWLRSADTRIPPIVQLAIRDRMSWQQPKAMICSFLLVCFTLLSTWIWHSLIRRSRTKRGMRTTNTLLFASAIGTTSLSILMMIMALANIQAVFAPITLTLMFS